ncbi:hypothetical protein H1R20_g871, partial [Candolleomyces eurysporus]
MDDLVNNLIAQAVRNGRLEVYQNSYGPGSVHDQPQNIGGGTFIGYKSEAPVLSSMSIDGHLSELERRLQGETTPMQRAAWLERAKQAVAQIPRSSQAAGRTLGNGTGPPMAGHPPAAQGDGTPEPSSSSPVPQDHPYSQAPEKPTSGAHVQIEGESEWEVKTYNGLRENPMNIGPGGVFINYKTNKASLEDCLREAIQRAEQGRLSGEQAGQIVAIVEQRLAESSV